MSDYPVVRCVGSEMRAASGAIFARFVKEYLVTLSGGTDTVTVTGAIPAGAMDVTVTALVTTIIAGSDGIASWQLGQSGDDDQWGVALALAAGTKVGPTDYVALTPIGFAADTDITIKGTAGKVIDSGAVRLVIFFSIVSPPLS